VRTPAAVARWVRRRGLALSGRGVTVPALLGAALVGATSAIHLHLWLAGYRYVPGLRVAFLAQALGGFVLATALAVARLAVLAWLGALFMAACAGALVLSATVGFLGVHDGLGAPWAATSLVVELAGSALLASAGVAAVRPPRRRRAGGQEGCSSFTPN